MAPLPRDKCKITQQQIYIELPQKATLPQKFICDDPGCKDKLSKARYTYLESASRAALALELQISMRDKIVYLAASIQCGFAIDLPKFRHNILASDAENLAFLDKVALKSPHGQYITDETLRKAYNWTLIASQNAESTEADIDLVNTADTWRAWFADDTIDHETTTIPYQAAIASVATFRNLRFAYTEHGYMCLVPDMTQIGDDVIIADGHCTPHVIRPAVADYSILLGTCYVHGMMKGDMGALIEEFKIKFDE